jgi:hypothetical protein
MMRVRMSTFSRQKPESDRAHSVLLVDGLVAGKAEIFVQKTASSFVGVICLAATLEWLKR